MRDKGVSPRWPLIADNSDRWPQYADLAPAAGCDCQALAIAIAEGLGAARPVERGEQAAPVKR